MPRCPRPSHGELADARGVLAHAAGEHERVEPAERCRHRPDTGSQPVHVDVDRQPRVGVVAREQLAHVGRARRGRAGRTRARAPRPSRRRETPSCCWSQSSRPGSTEPDRVAITRPSSGVKPMVVSTERPSRTAHSDAPAPRWHVTTCARRPRPAPRTRARGRGSRSAARRSARATRAGARRSLPAAGAWRGRPCRSRRPRARRGNARRTASSAASDFGWWSGASAVSSGSAASTCLVDDHRLAKALAPVDDPVPSHVGVARAAPRERPPRHRARPPPAAPRARAPRARCRRVEQRELQAARPGVGDEHAHVPGQPGTPRAGSGARGAPPGHVQSRTSGGSSPCSRV